MEGSVVGVAAGVVVSVCGLAAGGVGVVVSWAAACCRQLSLTVVDVAARRGGIVASEVPGGVLVEATGVVAGDGRVARAVGAVLSSLMATPSSPQDAPRTAMAMIARRVRRGGRRVIVVVVFTGLLRRRW
jgi:hypothetical protein